MAVVCEIAAFDRVELIEPVDDAPAGARGGVLELGDGDTAMVDAAPRPQAASCLIAASSTKLSNPMAIVWSSPTSSGQMSAPFWPPFS